MAWTCGPRRRRRGRSQPAGQRSGARTRRRPESGRCRVPDLRFRRASWRRVLDSSGPLSPKPTRIYRHLQVSASRRPLRRPHWYAVSGSSTPRSRLPENRGVPVRSGASPFSALPANREVLCPASGRWRSRWARFSGFGVQFTVLNGPHPGGGGFHPGYMTAAATTVARQRTGHGTKHWGITLFNLPDRLLYRSGPVLRRGRPCLCSR